MQKKWHAGFDFQRTMRETNADAVRALAAAGVPMVTGTDGGNRAVFQGYSVHRELRLLVDAGLPPWDALASEEAVPKGRVSGEYSVRSSAKNVIVGVTLRM